MTSVVADEFLVVSVYFSDRAAIVAADPRSGLVLKCVCNSRARVVSPFGVPANLYTDH